MRTIFRISSFKHYFNLDFNQVSSSFLQDPSFNSSFNGANRTSLMCLSRASAHVEENERLTKLYTESLNKLAVQLERHIKCQTLEEELKRVNDERLIKEDEHRKAMELLTQDHAAKVENLEIQIRGYLHQNEANEATINHLSQDLALHKTHIQSLTNRLERVCFDVESKYHHESQDLKDCLLVEQEEKNELNKKLQNLEKELLFSRTRLAEQQRDSNSSRNVEMLKEKIMSLRKENEVLKRQINGLQKG